MIDGLRPEAFVSSMTTRIERHVLKYVMDLDRFFERELTERNLLDTFNSHVEQVVARYDPPGIRRSGDSLVFTNIYETWRDADPVDELLTVFLAAEVEFRGPLRLSNTQNSLLAAVYERVGAALVPAGLPAHAALAYQRAAGLYRQNENVGGEDRCGLAQARARRLTNSGRWRRAAGILPDLLCGYGYRPFWLLGWITLQLVVFSVALHEIGGIDWGKTLHLCLTSYLNPLGPGDTNALTDAGRALLVAESYVGLVSTSVFFALLVRRWFRL